MAHRHTQREGFTLIELLVVIGIIVVLLAILLPVIAAAQDRARRVNCMANLHDIAMAARLFYQDNKSYPGESIWDATNNRWEGGVSALYPDYLESAKALICPRDKLFPTRYTQEQRYSSYNWFDANKDGKFDQNDAMTYNCWGFFEMPDPNHTGTGTPGVVDDPHGLPYGVTGGWNQNLTQVWNNNPAIGGPAKWPALANPSAPGNTILCVCRHHEGRQVELIVRLSGQAKEVKISDMDFISQPEL